MLKTERMGVKLQDLIWVWFCRSEDTMSGKYFSYLRSEALFLHWLKIICSRARFYFLGFIVFMMGLLYYIQFERRFRK
jgi:hypothetical protein